MHKCPPLTTPKSPLSFRKVRNIQSSTMRSRINEFLSSYKTACVLFGIFPLQGHTKLTSFYCLLLFALVTSNTLLACWSVLISESALSTMLIRTSYKLINFSYYFTSCMLFFKRKDILEVESNLNNLETYLSKYGINVTYKTSIFPNAILRWILVFLSFFAYLSNNFYKGWRNIHFVIVLFVEIVTSLASSIYMYAIYYYVYLLALFLREKLDEILTNYPYEGFYDKIRCMLKVHSSLIALCFKLDGIFWTYSLFNVFTHFSLLTFEISEFVWNQRVNFDYFMCVKFVLSIGYLCASLFFLVHSCERLIRQIDSFTEVLYDGILKDHTGYIYDKEELHFSIESQAKVEFTGYGMFKLDYALLLQMFGAMTSFNVILFQAHS